MNLGGGLGDVLRGVDVDRVGRQVCDRGAVDEATAADVDASGAFVAARDGAGGTRCCVAPNASQARWSPTWAPSASACRVSPRAGGPSGRVGSRAAMMFFLRLDDQLGDLKLALQLRVLAAELVELGLPGVCLGSALLGELFHEGHRDPETVGIYARTWTDCFAKSKDPRHLLHARDLYRAAFAAAPDDYYCGINAAAKSVMLGDDEVPAARELAGRLLKTLGHAGPRRLLAHGDHRRGATDPRRVRAGRAPLPRRHRRRPVRGRLARIDRAPGPAPDGSAAAADGRPRGRRGRVHGVGGSSVSGSARRNLAIAYSKNCRSPVATVLSRFARHPSRSPCISAISAA